MSGEGAQLLYHGATGFEKALAHVEGDRLIAIPAELIRDVWDPEKIPFDLLPYLAWAMGVEFWIDEWSETTKRQWVASQWLFKSMRGTEGALRMAVDYAGRNTSRWGYTVNEVITRPQKIFSGPSLTREQREDWLSRMPQIRVWRMQEPGEASPYKTFYGGSGDLRQRDYRFCIVPILAEGELPAPLTIAVGKPVIGTPVLGTLYPNGLAASPLNLPRPVFHEKQIMAPAVNLTVGRPWLYHAYYWKFTTAGKTVGSPTFGTPVFKQAHKFIATALTVSSPTHGLVNPSVF